MYLKKSLHISNLKKMVRIIFKVPIFILSFLTLGLPILIKTRKMHLHVYLALFVKLSLNTVFHFRDMMVGRFHLCIHTYSSRPISDFFFFTQEISKI